MLSCLMSFGCGYDARFVYRFSVTPLSRIPLPNNDTGFVTDKRLTISSGGQKGDPTHRRKSNVQKIQIFVK